MTAALTPMQRKIVDRLRDGPMPSSEATALGMTRPKSLHVLMYHIRKAGFHVRCDMPDRHGSPGCSPGVYVLTHDPEPPFAPEYDAMAQSMGVG